MPVDHQEIAAALDAAMTDQLPDGYVLAYWIPAVNVPEDARDRAEAEMLAAMRRETQTFRDAWQRPEMDDDLDALPAPAIGSGWQMTIDLLYLPTMTRVIRTLGLAQVTAILDSPASAAAKRGQVQALLGPLLALCQARVVARNGGG